MPLTMYLSEKPRQLDFYKEDEDRNNMNLILEAVANGELQNHQRMLLGDSSSEDHDVSNNNNLNNNNNNSSSNSHHSKAPKKRAETWIQDETRSLIAIRRDMDGLFNTSKSNKHLWEQISSKMRENGFDRSPTMCTDKWRNLLKEFKKAKHHDRGGGSGKMSCYKEIDEILKERNRHAHYKASKVDSFMQFSDKGMEDTSISFASLEANGRPTLNLERCLDHDGHPLAITAPEPCVGNGVPPCDWTVPPRDGGENPSYGGRVVTVKWGDYTRRIGIDGSVDAIKESIKSVFGLRTKRAFWLEDQDGIVRSLDRDMPLQEYNLQLDEGISIKVCLYDQSDRIVVHTEDKTFYTDEDFREFLARRGWTCLRDINGYGSFANLDNLRSGEMYRGVN